MKTCPYCGFANPISAEQCERCTYTLSSNETARPHQPVSACPRCGSKRLIRCKPYASEGVCSIELHEAERPRGFFRSLLPATIALYDDVTVCFDCGSALTQVDVAQMRQRVLKRGSEELKARLAGQ